MSVTHDVKFCPKSNPQYIHNPPLHHHYNLLNPPSPATSTPSTTTPATIPTTSSPATTSPATSSPATTSPATSSPATTSSATSSPSYTGNNITLKKVMWNRSFSASVVILA